MDDLIDRLYWKEILRRIRSPIRTQLGVQYIFVPICLRNALHLLDHTDQASDCKTELYEK